MKLSNANQLVPSHDADGTNAESANDGMLSQMHKPPILPPSINRKRTQLSGSRILRAKYAP